MTGRGHGQYGFHPEARLRVVEPLDNRVRQAGVRSGQRASGQQARHLQALVQRCVRRLQAGDEEIVDTVIIRREAAEGPDGPCFRGAGQAAAFERRLQFLSDLIAPSEQFLLSVGPPDGEWEVKHVDQLAGGGGFDGWSGGCRRGIFPADAINSALVGHFAIGEFSAVTATPAEAPESAVWPEFQIDGTKERCSAGDKFFPVTALWAKGGAVPVRTKNKRCLAQPVIDEPDMAIVFGKLGRMAEDDAGAGPLEKRSADWSDVWFVHSCPPRGPRMVPAEMRALKGRKNTVSLILVVVGAEPVKAIIKANVPWIAKPPGDEFRLGTIGRAAENASFATPVVRRVMIRAPVAVAGECLRRRHVGRAGWGRHTPHVPKHLGGVMVGLVEPLGIAFAHVEPPVGRPV